MRAHYIPSLPGESMTSESLRNPVAMKSTPASLSDWAEVIGRIGLALLFLWSGYEKLAHPASTVAYMQAYGLPAADLLIWPALLLELAGGGDAGSRLEAAVDDARAGRIHICGDVRLSCLLERSRRPGHE